MRLSGSNEEEFLQSALEGVTVDFVDHHQRNLLDRWTRHHEWLEARAKDRVDPYSRYTSGPIGPEVQAFDRWGRPLSGGGVTSPPRTTSTSPLTPRFERRPSARWIAMASIAQGLLP